ncbi:regulatory protein RecX [Peptoclostridium acidaminophilum DSM 3953]|uniref:Regulatory protein RecX n=1 Tax=Peptoclostridium acidaminophilum DSM 3953 TaxID=1286171 RepID=W8TG58_PEPAC|nr:regulatory protein RecX [Peptoclostridium acidaminophilum]AHM56818.1 regulatory protein RecX [Peptoclostridium acidaminophilum DSM 3953]
MIKITRIERKKYSKGVWSLYSDEEHIADLHEDVLVQNGINIGKTLSKEDIDGLFKDEERAKAMDSALRQLSYRMKSEKELKDSLGRKGYSAELVEDVMSELKKRGYVDDQGFARMYAQSLLSSKKDGSRAVKMKLSQKGISREVTQSVVEELTSDEKEYEAALELAMKKLRGSYKNDEPDAIFRKLGGFLSRKGYSYEIVMKVLRKVTKKETD